MPLTTRSPKVATAFAQARAAEPRSLILEGQATEIPHPFPSPADWRDQWIYFLLIDRFNNPQGAPRCAPFDGMHGVFQGGTFNGVREQLGYLQQLGVGAIWLSPVLKNCQYNSFTYHGYGFQDFLQVDPRFASDPQAAQADPQLAEDELRALIDEAHARGIYVIFDIVLNHAGDVFEYVLDDGAHVAETDWRDHPYTINWRAADGHGRPDWTAPPTIRRLTPPSGRPNSGAMSSFDARAEAARPGATSPPSRNWSPVFPGPLPRRAFISPFATF